MKRLRSTAAAIIAIATFASCARTNTTLTQGRHPWTQPGHLRLGYSDEPDSLNKLFANDSAADEVANLLFAPMFRFDDRGELLPELATTVPTQANGGITPDGRTITLHVRHGVRWSDGAPLDARDLRFTWRAVMNPRNNVRSRAGWEDITAIDLPNRYTLVVHVRRPNASLIAGIFGSGGGSAYPPLPAHLLERLPDFNRAAFNAKPISSGPWLLREWNRGTSLEFTPNARYWRGTPKLRALTWKVIPNTDTLFAELQTHDIDVYPAVGDNQIARLPTLAGVRVMHHLIAYYRHVEINTSRPYLHDVRVRRALAEAVDWDAMNRTVYHGYNLRATSDIMPTSWAAPSVPFYPYSPSDAERLLAAAGWQPGSGGIRHRAGEALRLVVSTGTNKPQNEQAELLMQQQLRAVGIDLAIKNYPVSFLFAQNGPLYGGHYDLSLSIETGGPEPDNSVLWSSASIPPHGANTAWLSDPVVDATSDAALRTYDRAKRKALYQREELRLHELVPAIILYWQNEYIAANSDLRGYKPAPYVANSWNSWEWTL